VVAATPPPVPGPPRRLPIGGRGSQASDVPKPAFRSSSACRSLGGTVGCGGSATGQALNRKPCRAVCEAVPCRAFAGLNLINWKAVGLPFPYVKGLEQPTRPDPTRPDPMPDVTLYIRHVKILAFPIVSRVSLALYGLP